MATPNYSRVPLSSKTTNTTPIGQQFLTNDSDPHHGGGWWASVVDYFRTMNKKKRFWLSLMIVMLLWVFVIYLVNSALSETHDAHMENTKHGMEVKVPAQTKEHDKLDFQVGTHLKNGHNSSISVHDHAHNESGALQPVHHKFDTRVFNNTFSIAQTVCRGHFEGGKCHGVLGRKFTKFIPLEKGSTATASHRLRIQVTRKNIHFHVNGKAVAFHRIEAHPKRVTHLTFHGKWLMKRPRWVLQMRMSDVLQKMHAAHKRMVGNMHKKEIEDAKPEIDAPENVHENADAHKNVDAPENVGVHENADAHEKDVKVVEDKQ